VSVVTTSENNSNKKEAYLWLDNRYYVIGFEILTAVALYSLVEVHRCSGESITSIFMVQAKQAE
jgi:hypothetical protein